jgi:hypothetical protein
MSAWSRSADVGAIRSEGPQSVDFVEKSVFFAL